MPSAERVLSTVRKAIPLVKATAGRVGHIVHLQDAADVMIAGDLHGNVANFQAVFRAADLMNQPRRHLVLQELIHSPFRYSNGSDKSHQLVDLTATLICQFPGRVHYLPGNHEVAQWTDREIGKSNESLNLLFRNGVMTAYGPAGAEIYQAYCQLFEALPLVLRTANGVVMCHTMIPNRQMAQFEPKMLNETRYDAKQYQPGGMVYGLVWGRDTQEQTAADFLRKLDSDWLITGHIPTETGYLVPNSRQIIVDCSQSPGCYIHFTAEGVLTFEQLIQGLVTI